LYETHKATTYPRSDSGYLPESMFSEAPTVLASLVETDPGLRPLAGRLDPARRSRAWDDGKVTAHHGIIPTLEPVKLSAMNDKEQAVYRLIRAHYLAQFLPPHEFDRTKAVLSANGETLQANGKRGGRRRLAGSAGAAGSGRDGSPARARYCRRSTRGRAVPLMPSN
jgi:DNA topoisomerase-3